MIISFLDSGGLGPGETGTICHAWGPPVVWGKKTSFKRRGRGRRGEKIRQGGRIGADKSAALAVWSLGRTGENFSRVPASLPFKNQSLAYPQYVSDSAVYIIPRPKDRGCCVGG